MRRLSIAALMAVPLFLTTAGKSAANPPPYNGSGNFGLNLFKGIHQHGPLFNYGPYHGYYPFKPYGPWDEYLRYNPYFYGDPYRDWMPPQPRQPAPPDEIANRYGRNQNLPHLPRLGIPHIGLPHWDLFHKYGCKSCGLSHASWLHGGWFRGHVWLHGGSFGLFHKSCSSCGGIATVGPVQPTGDVLARYSGIGSAEQSTVFYSATPTLNPVLDLVPAEGQAK